MDSILFDAIDDQMPKFNPLIADGLAVSQLEQCELFIDKIFQSVSTSFPAGLKYEGYMRCTPFEEYNLLTDKRGTKRYCDIARSDIYLVKYIFSFQGKPLFPRYIYLPFVNDAGLLTIRASKWMVSPVLSDRVLSIEYNSIFIVLNCAKLKFERSVQHYMANRNVETVNVIWSAVHNEYRKKKGRDKASIDAFTTLTHYLFCKYGVVETFKKYANADVIISEDISEEKYPANKWVICNTIGNKPAKMKEKYYMPTKIKLAIPVEQYNQVTKSLIGGMFYTLEHFPDRFNLRDFNNVEEEKILWKILLGHLIFAAGSSEGDLYNKVEEHFVSLDEYIDGMDKVNLIEDGIFVDDIYQLFIHIIETMADRLLNAGNSVSSMYGKQLTIPRYLLYNIRANIVKTRFALKKNDNKRPLTPDDINKLMNRELPKEMIASINKEHGEVTSVSCPGDNKIFKVTSNITMQTKSGSNAKGKNRGKVNDPSKILHTSIAEVGSFVNLPQSDPTGRSRVNPYLQLAPDGSILRNEKFTRILDDVQLKIER